MAVPAELFPDDRPPRPAPSTYRVTVVGGAVVVRSPNLPFALAQARALALAGRRCWLRDDAGACVEVRRYDAAVVLVATSGAVPTWLGACRALLEHLS
ncbi:MAG TPA: hypothetical protein VFJ85_12840 [Acidimicrobiales bacterium]|nr:hypothetical protein [Acidimicrobiales bacterium]